MRSALLREGQGCSRGHIPLGSPAFAAVQSGSSPSAGNRGSGHCCRGRRRLGTGQRLAQAWLRSCGLGEVEQIASPGWASVPLRKEKVRTTPHLLSFQPVEALLMRSLLYQHVWSIAVCQAPGAQCCMGDACRLPGNWHFSKETDNK